MSNLDDLISTYEMCTGNIDSANAARDELEILHTALGKAVDDGRVMANWIIGLDGNYPMAKEMAQEFLDTHPEKG